MQADWQPIETAPKDGRPLLLSTDKGFMVIGKRNKHLRIWVEMDGRETPREITHWMPLPPTPKDGVEVRKSAIADLRERIAAERSDGVLDATPSHCALCHQVLPYHFSNCPASLPFDKKYAWGYLSEVLSEKVDDTRDPHIRALMDWLLADSAGGGDVPNSPEAP